MKIGILHLSDIHIRTTHDPVLGRGLQIASTTYSLLPEVECLFIVVSGDIAYGGQESEYKEAESLFNQIKASILEQSNIAVHFIMVPGNHDCNFTDNQSIRDILIEAIISEPSKALDKSVVEGCTSVQGEFVVFRNKLESEPPSFQDSRWTKYQFDVAGHQIVFDCINVAWMSRKSEAQGKLLFPVEAYQDFEKDTPHLRLAVLHHPFNWFGQSTYHTFKSFIRSISEVVFTGHEHTANYGENWDPSTNESIYIEGGVLQAGHHPDESSFNLVTIDLSQEQYRCERFSWDGARYYPTDGAESWSTYRKYVVKQRSEFEISAEFLAELNNPGANFSHPSIPKITLDDIYVFPDLRLIDDAPTKDQPEISSSVLVSPEKITSGVLIQGEEKTGKTSLLYTLFKRYQSSGVIPIIIRGKDLSKVSDKELRATIDRAIGRQYGTQAIVPFHQLPKAKKVLLLDDIDQQKAPEKNKGKALKYLLGLFGGVIATSNDLFELDELISSDVTDLVGSFQQYRLLPFGYKLRLDLVRKWANLGSEDRDPQALMAMVDKVEKLLNTIIGKNLIPSVPIYLLILMQSFEAGKQGDLQNSAFGHYYEFLILHSLTSISIKHEEVDEFINYCCQLAWFTLQKKVKELELNELKEFSKAYSEEYAYVELTSRLNQLCTAKLLIRHGESYSFCYPYVYYFFLGKYLAENLNDGEVSQLVRHYCSHLYVKDYANTILFLTHHSKSPFIYDSIKAALAGLFNDKPPIDYDGDTEMLNELVESAPSLIYHKGNAEEQRREIRELQDDIEAGSSSHSPTASQELDGDLDLPSKLNFLFKTVEILGQILKNHYGSLRNSIKEELLHELFDGPLRALREFFELIHSQKDLLVADIAAHLQRGHESASEDDCKKFARRYVFDLVGMVSTIFIYKTATSVSSEKLLDVISKVVNESDSVAYKLIEITAQLDLPNSIPFAGIDKLAKNQKNNPFVIRLMQSVVIGHLYMFKTSDADKQKLCSELGIQISRQRIIDYKTKDTKRLVNANSEQHVK
ncbi:DNA repair exonuclease [Novimethylophilus kurashikiensis]|uniref:DNA repair exonuclease n=1 Tax=Novimethylophilus kurashikiensis TaxID=1825523 RepID=A0A2R5F5T5_9PROT|nr:metallophosphoesterase [Novimethylophilus kurashikiensis]GBG12988.1 DNA repair exonuclease [Novimethylophilus kurashikiensis]